MVKLLEIILLLNKNLTGRLSCIIDVEGRRRRFPPENKIEMEIRLLTSMSVWEYSIGLRIFYSQYILAINTLSGSSGGVQNQQHFGNYKPTHSFVDLSLST